MPSKTQPLEDRTNASSGPPIDIASKFGAAAAAKFDSKPVEKKPQAVDSTSRYSDSRVDDSKTTSKEKKKSKDDSKQPKDNTKESKRKREDEPDSKRKRSSHDRTPPPSRPQQPTGPMIIVTVNDRLGTKAQIPALPSDTIGDFKKLVAMKIGRKPHEIMIKRQSERPFKDLLTLEDYGVGHGVQLDLELDTGD